MEKEFNLKKTLKAATLIVLLTFIIFVIAIYIFIFIDINNRPDEAVVMDTDGCIYNSEEDIYIIANETVYDNEKTELILGNMFPYSKTTFAVYEGKFPYLLLGSLDPEEHIDDEDIDEIIKNPISNVKVARINAVKPKNDNLDNLYIEEVTYEFRVTQEDNDSIESFTNTVYKYYIYTSVDKEKLISIFSSNDEKTDIKNVELIYAEDGIYCLRINDYFTYKSQSNYGQRYVWDFSDEKIDEQINSLVAQVKKGNIIYNH